MNVEFGASFKRDTVVVVDDEIAEMGYYRIPGIFTAAAFRNPLFYRAELFDNASTACKFLQEHHGDVMGVFTDCSMSGRGSRDGFEFAKWIRERLPSMPVVMISGNAINRSEAEQSGVHVAVIKDGNLETIGNVSSSLWYLRQYLEGRPEALEVLKKMYSGPVRNRMLMVR